MYLFLICMLCSSHALLHAADSSLGGFPDGILFNGEYNSAITYDDIDSHEPVRNNCNTRPSSPCDSNYPCCTSDEIEETWRWGRYEHRWAQEHENKSRAQLRDGMWGTPHYYLPEYTSHSEQLSPITAESVTTPFFTQLADKEEKDKVAILKIAAEHPTAPCLEKRWYLERRSNIAALVLIAKINLKALGEHHHVPLLTQATEYEDFYLAQLLLENGLSVHECDERRGCGRVDEWTPIFSVKNKELALLLIKRGALKDGHAQTLLHHTMHDDGYHQCKLATFYIEQGADIFALNQWGNTALFSVIPFTLMVYNEGFLKKAKILLEPLSPEKKVALINHINYEGKNVINTIVERKKEFTWSATVERLDVLQKFLEHVRDHPEEKL